MKTPLLAKISGIIVFASAISFFGTRAFAQSAPTVTTGSATSFRPGQATVSGTINPNQLPTSYWFEHGINATYGRATPTNLLASGNSSVNVSNLLTGLPRGVGYNFRLVASNSLGRVNGSNMTFSVTAGSTTSSGSTGGNLPFDIRQPSLELNYIISMAGTFPAPDGAVFPPYFAEVRLFAGSFAPAGWQFCHGQILSIEANDTLFNVIGTTYGGDGVFTFALPDFRGRTFVGRGAGPDGVPYLTGDSGGANETTLIPSQLPLHSHPLPFPDFSSGFAGLSQPYNNMQPFQVMSALLYMSGAFPSQNNLTDAPMVGQISFFAGDYSLKQMPFVSGQILSIAQNQAVFALLGTTYGGNGQTTFALPNLNGRAPMHTGMGPGPNNWGLGQQTGSASSVLTSASLPTHQHAADSLGFNTGLTGDGQAQSLMQPSLTLRYLIATNGYFPARSDQAPEVSAAGSLGQMLGEIILFASTVTPKGWIPCEGQLLPVATHTALFSLIGTNYGGNGIQNFAIPDLSSRIPVGAPDGICGATHGAQQTVLTTAQIPAHTHTVPQLDFDRWITSFGLSGSDAAFENDSDHDGVKNGLEWASATNPTNASSLAPLTIQRTGANVTVRFPRNTNATDLRLIVQRTGPFTGSNSWGGIVTNLFGTWTPPAPPVTLQESGATNPVTVHVSASRTNSAANYRLKVE